MATNNKIATSTLGLAAEYAVAAELCRRNVYAQLTLGNQKRTDLLVFSEAGEMARLEVKAKQGSTWPACKGIAGPRSFLVFVDFQGCPPDTRPAFYVLNVGDWRNVVKTRAKELLAKDPKKKIVVGSDNIPVFPNQVGKSGKPYKGISVKAGHVKAYRGQWSKVLSAVAAS